MNSYPKFKQEDKTLGTLSSGLVASLHHQVAEHGYYCPEQVVNFNQNREKRKARKPVSPKGKTPS